MDKPINLKTVETKEALAKNINESKLPITIISYILQELYNEARLVEQNIVEKEREEYKQFLSGNDDNEG